MLCCNITSYTDGNTLYDSGDTTEDVIITAKFVWLVFLEAATRGVLWKKCS